jgi:hypothetical protein
VVWVKVMGPVLVNPLGAKRTMEALSQVFFEWK